MKTTSDRYSTADEGSALWDLLRGALLFIWCVVRVPIGIVLAILEPFVRLVLIGIAFASVITAFVFKGSSVTPAIPFWAMICISFGCVMLLALYHGLLRLLSR
jgi:peptidoglycan/LPS O-acetylase OafA/YrhL